ncbi:hypothetical protein [Nocardia cyriacigeorgica]|uniref:hypothetical protein n=1 Tax=Nocardia cyriacigeorgica TaxID=135487 RepID=UPI002457E08A|nr:hypothetical protein [Nocardia cyriacigeorgica]
MPSDRDTLTYLILDCQETAATPRETADYVIERGWRPPARVERSRLSNLDALPVGSLIVAGAISALKTVEFEPGVTDGDGYRSEWATLHGTVGTFDLNLPAVVVREPEQESRR